MGNQEAKGVLELEGGGCDASDAGIRLVVELRICAC